MAAGRALHDPLHHGGVHGSLLLAAAGLLDGLTATTHWAAYDEFAAKAMQLMCEYDPQPPFDCGALAKCGPDVIERLRVYTGLKD